MTDTGEYAVFPVAAATMAGWLILLFVLLVVPPPRAEASPPPAPDAEPPAVVSLLARRLRQDGFGATLLDLAARGWFSLSEPPGRWRTPAFRSIRGRAARPAAGGRIPFGIIDFNQC
jgi:hypothetical protein